MIENSNTVKEVKTDGGRGGIGRRGRLGRGGRMVTFPR